MKITTNHWLKAAATLVSPVVLPEPTRDIITTLCQYFSEDPAFEKTNAPWLLTENPSLKKGIMLIGPNGVGKTFLFEVFHRLSQFGCTRRYFQMTDGRTVATDVAKNGYEAISKYIGGDKLFNELGSELPARFYGNPIDAMYEVIFEREKVFQAKLQKTHITTNLSAQQLADRYDSAIFSRLRGMCNIIQYGGAGDTGSDLRGFSLRVNTHVNYADLAFRLHDYFAIVDEIKQQVYAAEDLPVMLQEVETRIGSVECLYPGIFGPYLTEMKKFVSHCKKQPQNLLEYAKKTTAFNQEHPEAGADQTDNGIGDVLRISLAELRKKAAGSGEQQEGKNSPPPSY